MKHAMGIALAFCLLPIMGAGGCTAYKAARRPPPEVRYARTSAKVQAVYQDGRFVLLRDGVPYYVKGAGTHANFDELRARGGNSVRTWGEWDAASVLDRAQALGLTVTMGLEVKKEIQGFDYGDSVQVAKQLEAFRKVVRKYKDHPALLAWGIGNELNNDYSDKRVWNAVNNIARMIHREDPNHPAMTVIGSPSRGLIADVVSRAPEIDILGLNSYGKLPEIEELVKASAWNGPYLVTEWGPVGFWESPSTSWDRRIEPPSAEKAAQYLMHYQHITKDSDRCLGSYVFFWDQKQECTSTWFGVFMEKNGAVGLNGETAETVDAMQRAWTGSWPENRAPVVSNITVNGRIADDDVTLAPNADSTGEVTAMDREGDDLTFSWEVIRETDAVSLDGRPEPRLETVLKKTGSVPTFRFQAPASKGEYRLFVYVLDGHGHAGTANIPFRVK